MTININIKENDIRHTIPLDTTKCPKCGQVGQRKYRRSNYKTGGKLYYEYFDHYKHPKGMSFYHGKYKSTCYIGVVT